MSFPIPFLVTVNCEKLVSLIIKLAFCLGHCIYVHSLSQTNCNQAVNLPLFFKRRVEKKKFEDVFAFPEEKEEERQMVGTAGRRLLSDLCFYFSFEVISFYSIFHITCFLKTGGGLFSW